MDISKSALGPCSLGKEGLCRPHHASGVAVVQRQDQSGSIRVQRFQLGLGQQVRRVGLRLVARTVDVQHLVPVQGHESKSFNGLSNMTLIGVACEQMFDWCGTPMRWVSLKASMR